MVVMEFKHTSVLLDETIENLNIKPNGVYMDGTLGGAGHSREIAKRLGSDGHLIGIDQDGEAIGYEVTLTAYPDGDGNTAYEHVTAA